jgi:hypothetical protein
MNLLDWYDILLWKKDGKHFVSNSDYVTVYSVTKLGYELIGDMNHWAHEIQNLRLQLGMKGITNYEISELLDNKTIEPLDKIRGPSTNKNKELCGGAVKP